MTRTPLLAVGALLLGFASASAQEGPPGPESPMRPPMEWRHRMGPPMMPGKAAKFRFSKDGAEIGIKCAEDEPTRACVDAALLLIDKLAGPAK